MLNRAFVAIPVVLAIWAGPASGGAGGRRLIVSVTGAETGEIEKAASAGADGVLFVMDDPSKDMKAPIETLCVQTKKAGLTLWIGCPFPGQAPSLGSHEVDGLALILPLPKGEPAKPEDFDALMAIKKKGDELGDSIRRIRKELGAHRKLAVCAAEKQMDPQKTGGIYLPVEDLVRDGTLAVVCLGGAEGYNFHRLRLLRDAPLEAGTFLDGRDPDKADGCGMEAASAGRLAARGSSRPAGRGVDEKAATGVVGRATLAAMENDSCACLWAVGFPMDLVCRVVADTTKGYAQNQRERDAIEKAVANGEIFINQEVSEKNCNDQATIHGVGQSFIPSQDGLCPLARIYAAIRGCRGPLPPPLKVDIRIDDGDKPGGAAYAKTEIPASEFGHEPDYRWGNAYFDPPVQLQKGVRYWIYISNACYPEGNCVWRLTKDGATDRGHAWSSRYDYTKHSWVFRVYMKKK